MKKIDVCLSPDLLHLYNIEDKVVIIVDILRASSSIVTGLANAVKSIRPIADLEACRSWKKKGYIIAGERDGKRAEGFDLGNSPFHFLDDELEKKSIAMTTTNGTWAIEKSKGSRKILIGSFLNISTLANYLNTQHDPILILCAGWKGKINLEDTLFAGALIEKLEKNFELSCDAPLAAKTLYQAAKPQLKNFLYDSSHVKRLKKLNILKDVEFCLTKDAFQVVPILKKEELIALKIPELSENIK